MKLARVFAGGTLPFSLRVTNQGDRAAPPSRLRIALLPPARPGRARAAMVRGAARSRARYG